MTPHTCTERVDGCFRCELAQDEARSIRYEELIELGEARYRDDGVVVDTCGRPLDDYPFDWLWGPNSD